MPYFLVLVWLGLVVVGLTWFCRYQNVPGAQLKAAYDWPAGVMLPQNARRKTLVMIVHPLCPCSRASLAELDRLLTQCRDELTVDVVFVRYANLPQHLRDTENWRLAAAIPGVHLVCDTDGDLARRFGARTSGQCYLYDPSGRLLFQGGMTGGRGEEGDNLGLTAVASLVAGHPTSCSQTFVFGCPLFVGTERSTLCPSRL